MSSATYASLTLAGEIGAVDERVLNRHREIAQLPGHQIQAEAVKALRYELDLPADERRRRVIARLRAWLLLEPKAAERVASAFHAALDALEPDERHTIREAEEDAVMDGLSYREFLRLAQFMPSLQAWQVPQWPEVAPPAEGFAGSLAAVLATAGLADVV